MAPKNEDVIYLAHPVYLDVPMMVSFLATLDNGVAYSSEVAERLASTKDREGDASLKAGIPSLAQWLGLTLSAEGKYRRRSTDDESVEAKLVREHTSASLFNILRGRLLATNTVQLIGPGDDISGLKVGDLVEVRGTINGDPLRRFLALMSAIAPYIGWDLDGDARTSKPAQAPATRRKSQRNSTPSNTGDEGLDHVEIFRILKADVARSKVLDLTMQLGDGRHAVLAASSDYMTEATEQYMVAGSFAALGKVTQVLQPTDRVSLLRRTVFAVLDATSNGTATAEAFSSLADAMPGLDFSTLEVTGPGLQVLPLAIYV